jgi:chromosome segregation ATPase
MLLIVMNKKFSFSCLTLVSLFFSSFLSAQTIGIGEVTSIESKAVSIDKNKLLILNYREDIKNLEPLWLEKIQKAKNELAALIKERDNMIADMKVGAKCSECKRYKSQLEKSGINFQQHLGDVKGYAIPATTSELEAVRKDYTEKIALKRVQIQNLEKGDNAILKKQSDIKQLEKTNENLCSEITGHSKSYEIKVLAEAKGKHDSWIKDLVEYATNILVADDKIMIYKARIVRLDQEFLKESEEIKEAVRKQTVEAQNERENKISAHYLQIKEIEVQHSNNVAELQNNLNKLKDQKKDTEIELRRLQISDSTKAILTASLNQIMVQISALEQNLMVQISDAKAKILRRENEIKNWRDEIFRLKADLTRKQDQEIAKVKPGYDERKLAASESIKRSTSELGLAKRSYIEKEAHFQKLHNNYSELVVSESNRMIIAGQKVACAIWNEIRFLVNGNWNQAFPCVNKLTTLAKPYSTNVFNSYCTGQTSPSFMLTYKKFLASLDERDKEVVRRNSNYGWFELITKE